MFSKGGKRRPKALKQLAASELGLAIQEGQHSSVDDARAALYLYQKHAGRRRSTRLGVPAGEKGQAQVPLCVGLLVGVGCYQSMSVLEGRVC
jgi:hypothetical protein